MTKTTPPGKILAIAVFVIVISIVGYYLLNAPDKRGPLDKASDAVQELPNGVDKAARQLEDRTPGEKLKDTAADEVDDVKKATNQQ